MFESAVHPKKTLGDWLCILWLLSLVLWIATIPAAGMAFEGGDTLEAYTIACSILTYPVSVAIAVLLRRKAKVLLFLPLLNVLAIFCCGLLE